MVEYFRQLQRMLQIEKEADRQSYKELIENQTAAQRRANGMSWYPIAIRGTEPARGDYLTVEVERTTHHEVIHQLRFGMTAALFSNHNAGTDRVEGTITYISGNRLKIIIKTDELPDWCRNGKLGVDAVFDTNSYEEMEYALKIAPVVGDKKDEGQLVQVLTGNKQPTFLSSEMSFSSPKLNEWQNKAVTNILAANDLAIVHGPPGTGKTTTIVQAIKAITANQNGPVLVVAPSNAAVDLLTEKISAEGLPVVRIGNPAKVSEQLLNLSLDHMVAGHSSNKEIKRLRKQAAEFRDMAHKYKRSFGFAEREQRKALFNEVRNIMKEVERTEQYIIDDIIRNSKVITATLVGANHYTIRQLRYHTVVIDEAGQALEPACWIPILKAKKVIMAGDHWQLPPTVKSREAAQNGLSITLLEKCIALYPEAVIMLHEQYRMHKTIMGFSSKEFYENKLVANSSVANRLLFAGEMPLLFIDTAGCGFEEKADGSSTTNPEEAAFLVKHLSILLTEAGVESKSASTISIAVISPYKQQVELLKQLVVETSTLQHFNIQVNTIDSFQGQERDLVYISLTRSNTDNNIGFLSEVRRMNVAMTRAKKKLVVIGDSATLSQHSFYADFIEYAQQNDSYKSAWEFMDL